jgi:hypothetical protein
MDVSTFRELARSYTRHLAGLRTGWEVVARLRMNVHLPELAHAPALAAVRGKFAIPCCHEVDSSEES